MGDAVIVGDGVSNTNGISLQDLGRLNVAGIIAVYGFGGYNFYANVNSECNSTSGLLVCSASAKAGFMVDSGAIIDSAAEIIASGNGAQGIYIGAGAFVRSLQASPAVCASGNTGDGIYITGNAVFSTPGGWTEVTANGGYGVHTSNGAQFDSTYYGDSHNTLGLFGGGTLVNKGTLLASSGLVAGLLEYDGNAFYASPNTTVRGVVPAYQYSKVTAGGGVSLSNNTSVQSFLPSGAQNFPVVAGVNYRFRAKILISKNTANSAAVQFLFSNGGSSAFSWGEYVATSQSSTSAAGGSACNLYQYNSMTSAAACSPANQNQYDYIIIEGDFVMTTGGTIQPQIQFSNAPGGTSTALQGSYFELFSFGPNAASAGLS